MLNGDPAWRYRQVPMSLLHAARTMSSQTMISPSRPASIGRGVLRTVLGRLLAAAGLLLAACGGADAPPSVPEASAPAGTTVPVMALTGELDMGGMALLQRALGEARATESRRLVIEIDTPGGSLELMGRFSKVLDAAYGEGIATVAWVRPRAMSAGVLVALSCERIVMAEGAVIGAAQPIISTPLGVQAIPEEGGLREKISSSMRAEFRAMAEKHGRPGLLAEAMVDPEIQVRRVEIDGVPTFITGEDWEVRQNNGQRLTYEIVSSRGELVTLTSSEALEYGFADSIADDEATLIAQLGLSGATAHRLVPRQSEELLGRLNELGFFLLALGLFLGWIELKVPGFGLPGLLSIACFGLLLVGRHLVGLADIPHIVVATIGAALLVAELFILPGTIWLGLVGGLMLIGALLLGQLGPGFDPSSPLDRQLLFDTAFGFSVTALATLAAVWAVVHFLPEMPVLKRLTLAAGGSVPGDPVEDGFGEAVPESEELEVMHLGSYGHAVTDLRPVGKVVLDGAPVRPYEASSAGPAISREARVRVVDLRSGRLVVEPVREDLPEGTSPEASGEPA